MLLSHEKKFIFLKTLKTAGTSLEFALASQLGNKAIVTPQTSEEFPDQRYARVTWCRRRKFVRQMGIAVLENRKRGFAVNLVRDIAGGRGPVRSTELANEHDHITAFKIRKLIGEEKFNEYLKVAVCRNPYDQMVSLYFWRMHQRKINEPLAGPMNFDEWLVSQPNSVTTNRRLIGIEDKSVLDFVIRYEHLSEDVAKLCEMIGIDYAEVSAVMQKNRFKSAQRPKGPEGDPKLIISHESKAVIDTLMHWDFVTFGYEKIL